MQYARPANSFQAVAIASVYLLEALDLAHPHFGPLVPRVAEVNHHRHNLCRVRALHAYPETLIVLTSVMFVP